MSDISPATKLAIAGIMDKLERATGPDHKLDMEIFALERGWSFPLFGAALEEWAAGNRAGVKQDYTGSIDAAATVIPEGLYWLAGYGKTREDEPLGGAAVFRPGHEDDPVAKAEAPTVPLALCKAAFRAIAAAA